MKTEKEGKKGFSMVAAHHQQRGRGRRRGRRQKTDAQQSLRRITAPFFDCYHFGMDVGMRPVTTGVR